MNTLRTEETVKHVALSLIDHARSVYNYTANYCCHDDSNCRFDRDTQNTLRRHANRLVKDLYAMLLLSQRNCVKAYCNLEQVEAYHAAAHELLHPREEVVSYAGLFN